MDQILAKCLEGQKPAWDAFVDRYGPVILAAVRHLLRVRGRAEQATAEDIVQDVFLRLIKNDLRLLRSYDPVRASLATWLTIIARSTTIDFLRRRRLPVVPLENAPPVVAHHEPAEFGAPTDALPHGLLTGRQRLILHLIFDRQMDAQAAAALLGVSHQTIRSTKSKAIQRLREYFAAQDSG